MSARHDNIILCPGGRARGRTAIARLCNGLRIDRGETSYAMLIVLHHPRAQLRPRPRIACRQVARSRPSRALLTTQCIKQGAPRTFTPISPTFVQYHEAIKCPATAWNCRRLPCAACLRIWGVCCLTADASPSCFAWEPAALLPPASPRYNAYFIASSGWPCVSWANWWVTWVPPTNGDKVGFHPLMGINPC
jgi:hypothetical protein